MSSSDRVGTAIVFKDKVDVQSMLEGDGKGGRAMVPKTFVPAWEQEVRDKEGRRRFHGAFTGGFSAGYYNTVGSEKGWKPSQFQSSRSKRAERRQQRPEDFMDEDDDPLLGRKLAARDEFDTLGARAARRATSAAATASLGRSLIPGRVPTDLIVPSAVPVGKKLLRCMGWKEGQGLGPRVLRRRRRARRKRGATQPDQQVPQQQLQQQPRDGGEHLPAPANDSHTSGASAAAPDGEAAVGGPPASLAVRGIANGADRGSHAAGPEPDDSDVDSDATPPARAAPPPAAPLQGGKKKVYTAARGPLHVNNDDDDDEDDPYAEGILFAPKNTAVVHVKQKNNVFGLGFDPHTNAPEFAAAAAARSSALSLYAGQRGSGGAGAAGNGVDGKHAGNIIRMDAVFRSGGGAASGHGSLQALEEDGDVYGVQSMDTYDMSLPTAAERASREVLEDARDRRARGARSSGSPSSRAADLMEDVDTGRCFDGRKPLPGFRLATKSSTRVKHYAPLRVPRQFSERKRFSTPGPAQLRASARSGASVATSASASAQRAAVLGEQALVIPPALQPDMRTEWEQRRKRRQAAEKERSMVADRANSAIANRFVSKTTVGGTADGGAAQASAPDTGSAGGLKSVAFAPGLTVGAEIAKVAKQMEVPAAPEAAVDKLKVERPEPVRHIFVWAPHRLLCKRFNVPDPFKGQPVPQEATQSASAQFQQQVQALLPAHGGRSAGTASSGHRPDALGHTFSKVGTSVEARATAAEAQGPRLPATPANDAPRDTVGQAPSQAGPARPALDLLKAIFEPEGAGDSDDSSTTSDSDGDGDSDSDGDSKGAAIAATTTTTATEEAAGPVRG